MILLRAREHVVDCVALSVHLSVANFSAFSRCGDPTMMKRILWFTMTPALLLADVAIAQQYPMLDAVADRVVQKYQQSSCEQLWQERAAKKGKPMPEGEQRAIQAMHNDAQMRAAFIDRVAAPIANKLFECGMIP
jgi:hypothetical protein